MNGTLDLVLAVDAGSSFLNTAVFDRAGQLVGRTSRPYATIHPAPGFAEQDPETWIALIESTVDELRESGIPLDRLAGIALSARGGLAIFLDAQGQVLDSCWVDRRATGCANILADLVGEDLDYQTRGLASKAYFLRHNSPERFERLRYPLFARDFIQFRLTGTIATDPSSGPPNGVWPRRLWEAVGLPVDRLAVVRPHTELAGALTPAAANRLGLAPGLPVGIGGHDGACANAGAGAIRHGQVCLTLGTQGVARAVTSRVPANARQRRISPWNFLPGRWCCSGDLVLAGAAPTLVAALLEVPGEADGSIDGRHQSLSTAAENSPPGSGGVIYLPFPSGQVSPELRPNARGAFIGMSAGTTQADLYRASLEGVAFAFRSVVERERAIGLEVDDIRLSGGGARNPLWVQIMSDVLGEPLTVVEADEGARGAAMFLAVGLDWYRSPEDVAEEWVRPVRRVDPTSGSIVYERVYRRYCSLADAVYAADVE